MSLETFARLADAYEDSLVSPEMKKRGQRITPSKYPRCPGCGLRIKSAGHKQGEHHVRRNRKPD